MALVLGAALGVVLVAVSHGIARRDHVPAVPRRAMRELLERDRPNDSDGTR